MRYEYVILIAVLLFVVYNFILKDQDQVENYTGFNTPLFYDQLKKHNLTLGDNNTVQKCDKQGHCESTSYRRHFNTLSSVRLAKNKIETSTLLDKAGIPIPKFEMVSIREPAGAIVKKLSKRKMSFPIVLKPIKGTFGIDVIANIENNVELQGALDHLKTKPYFFMMCEEFIPGDVYRVFVFNGQVIDIIKREKPYITGDGLKTVKQLIKDKNKQQVKEGLFPTENIAYPYIKKQGYDENDVVGNYHKVYTSNVINAHNGARISRIDTSNIPSKNIDLFVKIGEVMGIKCYGLDYISKDINQRYDLGRNVILEVNGTPDTELHVTDGNGQKFFDKIVKRIF